MSLSLSVDVDGSDSLSSEAVQLFSSLSSLQPKIFAQLQVRKTSQIIGQFRISQSGAEVNYKSAKLASCFFSLSLLLFSRPPCH